MSKYDKIEGLIDKREGSDGGLYNLGEYISWSPEQEEACLDGYFSSEELKQIAEFMEENKT